MQKFNDGRATSSVGPQLTEYDRMRLSVTESKKTRKFTQIGSWFNIAPNSGDEVKRYREYPILHNKNINDQGLDANGLELLSNNWYAYKADGSRTVHNTEEAARAVANVTKVLMGGGALYAGSRDFALQNDSFPTIGEVGKNGNRVGIKREILTAKVQKYGVTIEYTSDALKFDTQTKLDIKNSREIGRLYSEVREAIVRNQLITAGMTNGVFAGGASTLAEVNNTSVLTYKTLRNTQTSLDLARCPYDTKIIKGSDKVTTVTVSAARYAFTPIQLEAEIEDLTHNGRLMFSDYASYAYDKGAMTAEGEFGKIGKFRFVSDFDFPILKGVGESVTDGADADGDGIEDTAAGYSTSNGKYDVAPILIVGSESFEPIMVEKDGFQMFHAEPKAITGLDNYADTGSVSVKWHQGIMINKPEWIVAILCSFKI